jgi:hypothetical protein
MDFTGAHFSSSSSSSPSLPTFSSPFFFFLSLPPLSYLHRAPMVNMNYKAWVEEFFIDPSSGGVPLECLTLLVINPL